jgi:hypothetical protein
VWPRWRVALVLIQPATVDRWHRARVVRRWWRRSRRPGRPRTICSVAISLAAWPMKIGCGARREFTANCSSLEWSFQNERSRVTCETGRRDRHRPGAHLSRITSASSNARPKCSHRMCRSMTSSTRLPVCVGQFPPTGCLRRGNAGP